MSKPELSQLGRYRIAGELGRGAMGVVYKAEDPVLNRTVAVKTILMPADAEARVEYEARFFQEAKAAAGLNHPNIITVHDAGREGDVVYMTMELLDGVDLRDFLKRGRVPLSLGLDIAAQLADGLAVAHDQGVVHRDIKPANIMVVRDRYAKIMDFGIARIRLSDVKTQTGALLGSPKYMSPEQVSGQRADHRSDIFSLGVTVYEMLVGQPPFSADDIGQLMYQVSMTPAEAPSSLDPSLPTMLDLVLAKALEKAAHARYQSARDFAADLRACQSELPAPAGPPPVRATAMPELDLALEASAVVQGRFPAQQTAGAARTLKLNATLTAGAAGNVQLSLSRRFDSSEASRRFEGNIAGLGGALAPMTPLQRVLNDPYRRGLTISLAAATVLALGIALL
jgi:eukaryotic-like serine/threonine-protein kinase